MKKTLLVALLAISPVSCRAISTGTTSGPVEQKVVEIHMLSKEAPVVETTKRRKTRRTETLPFGGGTCSGAFIDSVGDIITARHCVEGFDSFEVVTSDQRRYEAIIVAVSPMHDLAMVHIDRRNTEYFEAADSVTRGEAISVLGSPLGFTDTLSTGVIARFDGDVTFIDCGALPGNSGGPVFNREGKLVGVVSAGFIVMAGTTHLNVAQGIDAVVFFVNEALEKRHGR